jgi:hypothetical protein
MRDVKLNACAEGFSQSFCGIGVSALSFRYNTAHVDKAMNDAMINL